MLPKWIDINVCHFIIRLIKILDYKLYPNLPSAPPKNSQVAYAELGPSGAYLLNVIKSKREGLLKLEERCKKKYKKYTKILNRLTWLNACSNGISVTIGISSVSTLSTLISLPLSIPLGTESLAGVSVSGLTTLLTKKYQKKLTKVTKLTDIITSVLVVFERVVSKALKNGKIDEEEFNSLQTFHLKTMNEFTGIDRKMEAENRNQFEKSLLEEINNI